MDQILKFIEDKKFIRWVLEPNEELDLFWGNYILDNPGEKPLIEEAKIIVQQLKSTKDEIPKAETDALYANIMSGIAKKEASKSLRKINTNLLKYAAAIVVFISLGIVFFIFNKQNSFAYKAQNLKFQFVNNEEKNVQLALSDGNVVTIHQQHAFIELLKDQQIVINKKDTVIHNYTNTDGLNKIMVPLGKNVTLKLSDDSKVFLNAASQFVFPNKFDESKRQTYLTGEAFFEVTHNEYHPFEVVTNSINVEVLGTKFNLSVYPFDDRIETFLLEGKVKVVDKGTLFNKEEQFLNPLQSAIIEKDKKGIQIVNINDSEYVTWYKGYLNFKSTKLSDIVNKIERHFNVHITLTNPGLGNRIISGKLKLNDESVENVIQVLANTALLQQVKKSDNTYILKELKPVSTTIN